MATSGQGTWTPIGFQNNYVRDFRHAARIFGSNDFARAPKTKFTFFVRFIINPQIASLTPSEPTEMSYLVKTIELPKFDMGVQALNQYNRKVLVQRDIKYNPVTVTLHDDNNGTMRKFWQSYYNYYYADGRYSDDAFAIDDKYNTRNTSKWGLDTSAPAPYLNTIEVFSMYHGQAEKITFESPLISSFSHGSHDYSDSSTLMDASFSFQYTGVRYDRGIDAPVGITGFGQNSPNSYDVEDSPLKSTDQQIDPDTGELYTPSESSIDDPDYSYGPNPLMAMQTAIYNGDNTITNVLSDLQIVSILQDVANIPINAAFTFPTINTTASTFNQDYGVVPVMGVSARSNGANLPKPSDLNTLYPASSWQSSLYNKGYSPDQISSANKYLASVTPAATANKQQIAEIYIQNPKSSKLANLTTSKSFGHSDKSTTSINFSNPTISTKPTYSGNDWKSSLTTKGYSDTDISSAQKFLAGVRVSPSSNLSSIAENYIKNNKQGNDTKIQVETKSKSPVSTLSGPNFNPVSGTSSRNNFYKAV